MNKQNKDWKERLNKLRKVIPGVYDGWDIDEVKNFIQKEIDKTVEDCKQKMADSNEWWNKKLSQQRTELLEEIKNLKEEPTRQGIIDLIENEPIKRR